MEQLFIGRKQELDNLESNIFVREPSKEYSMRSASLVGPMGIGKSTLLNEAIGRFEQSDHPGVHLFQRRLRPREVFTVLLKDLVQQFAEKLTKEVLQDIQGSKNGLLQTITGIYAWFSENEEKIICNSSNDKILKAVSKKFEELLKAYASFEQHIILVINEFDHAKDMHQENGRNASIFSFFYGLSSKNQEKNLKLNLLLVCERRPQFLAASSGSIFEVAFSPIVLHNFNEEEMDEYFQSFAKLPCGRLENTIQNEILKYCGRFPQLLMDLRNQISHQGCQSIKEQDIKRFAERQERNGLYHHFCSLMESQWVDFGRHVSDMVAFRQYFIERRQDSVYSSYMGDLYSHGLVDRLKNGKYVPLTELDTESSEYSLLAYISANFPGSMFSTLDSSRKPALASEGGACGSEPAAGKASWLHLSDLHVFQEADTDFMLTEYRELAENIHPQFLIVTGDFRHKKQNPDFSNAMKFLEEILKIFDIKKENVILVPGNHDADDSTTEREEAIKEITENDSDYNRYSKHVCGPHSLYSNFYEYNKFVEKFYEGFDVRDKRVTDPSGTFHLVWNKQLNVLCANTALISNGKKDHKQIVDINSLVGFKIDTQYPTIMIGHHSIKALYEEFQSRVSNLFKNDKISAYLHGDIHQFNAGSISPIDETTLPVPSIACGKSAPQSGDDASEIGAIFYEWRQDNQVYVKFYQWKNRKLREKNDYQPKINMDYSFPMRC